MILLDIVLSNVPKTQKYTTLHDVNTFAYKYDILQKKNKKKKLCTSQTTTWKRKRKYKKKNECKNWLHVF